LDIPLDPGDGTCAVIDELKLCNTAWDSTRIYKEQTTCRYYTPGDPSKKGDCPIFTSQTMYQSLRGIQSAASEEWDYAGECNVDGICTAIST